MIRVLIIWAILYLGEKPKVGAITSSLGFITGTFISNAVMVLQVLALLISIFVGVLTVIGWFEKRRKKQ